MSPFQPSKHIPALAEPAPPPPPVHILSSHLDLLSSTTVILCSREDLRFLLATPHHPSHHNLPPPPKSAPVRLATPHPQVFRAPSPVAEDEDGNMSDVASSESSLTSIESSSNKIPKPDGEAGRPGRGGYNLEAQLAWDKAVFSKLKMENENAQSQSRLNAHNEQLRTQQEAITAMKRELDSERKKNKTQRERLRVEKENEVAAMRKQQERELRNIQKSQSVSPAAANIHIHDVAMEDSSQEAHATPRREAQQSFTVTATTTHPSGSKTDARRIPKSSSTGRKVSKRVSVIAELTDDTTDDADTESAADTEDRIPAKETRHPERE
ncbi:hypothetical protein HD554DRAFT_2176858 [Boletus coccyginus]|nr:hypothetical protein HD554DRAFT_2176858 [Boletus coccyginus]